MNAGVKNAIRAGVIGAAAAMTVSMTGLAAAEPTTPTTPAAPTSPAVPGEGVAPTLDGIPGDAELADLLRTLKSTGGSEQAIAALTSILGSSGQLDPAALLATFGINPDALASLLPSTTTPPTPPSAPPTTGAPTTGAPTTGAPTTDAPTTDEPAPGDPAVPGAPTLVDAPVTPAAADALTTLQKITGAQMLTPAIAPFCAAPTDDNPLGLVTAPTAAIPGPWPISDSTVVGDLLKGAGAGQLLKLLDPAATAPLQAVSDGQVAYALVPTTTIGATNLNVAWFNTSTMQGGLEPLKPLADDKTAGPLLKALSTVDGFSGVRLARASTGDGTVLSAVFGTATAAGRTCYFLPALGAVKA